MKQIICIILLGLVTLLYSCGTDCGTGAHGIIVDSNNNPIEGVKVLLEYDSREQTRYSDNNGEYSVGFMHGCPSNFGKGDLYISKEGYIIQAIKINGGDETQLDIVLEVDPQYGTE